MKVWNGLATIANPIGPASVAIGMFDGVHVGHQALIRAAVEDARDNGRAVAVFTFDRRPADIISPHRAQGYLTTPAQRERAIAALGVDHLVVAHFDRSLREMSPDDFLRDVLAGQLDARSVMVGEGFRFGHNQSGDAELLRVGGPRYGYQAHVMPPVIVGRQKASSSHARRLVQAGDVVGANAVLGRPFALAGVVVEGDHLGRKLGFPTANLRLDFPQIVPSDGIYAGSVAYAGRTYASACSIGVRPTVGGTDRRIEAHLLDFAEDLYGEDLEVAFIARLRDQARFETLDELVQQIARDVEQVRSALSAPVSEP